MSRLLCMFARITPNSNDAKPLPDFYPAKLPDGSWGAEFTGDTSSLPLVIVGHRIRVSPKRVKPWSATVTSTEPIVSLSLNFEADPVFSSLPPGELDAASEQ